MSIIKYGEIMLNDKELKQIETVVENGVLRGIQKCPGGQDREKRMRELEVWRNQLNGERRVYSSRKRDLVYPIIVFFSGSFIMFLIITYWPK